MVPSRCFFFWRFFLFWASVAGAAFGAEQERRPSAVTEPPSFSGRYPHLAMFNANDECGIGAVVPWAGRLWVVTYAPHAPRGSDDKLYEIDDGLCLEVRPESVGGTPANRLIHRESNQLFIGPYCIDVARNVRVIPYAMAPGRPTATARHLSDPAGKVYTFTMEEGLYEIDVLTLNVKTLHKDAHVEGAEDYLPGYHGKGAYSGQGRLIVANNGYQGKDRDAAFYEFAGCLAEWNGRKWTVIEENQHCEVTGPGGVYGSAKTDDPVWATGWDKRSLLLQVLDGGKWYTYRLPFADFSYVARHGWHTEWPRIREVVPARDDGAPKLLMNLHGAWLDFPITFSSGKARGLRPIGSYLKITGDFTHWNGRIVFGCDDTAVSAFSGGGFDTLNRLNGQSQSNLWFTTWEGLHEAGQPLGWGGPWLHDDVTANIPSDPYHFAGYRGRVLHLTHAGNEPVTFSVELDPAGDGHWQPAGDVCVPAGGYEYLLLDDAWKAEWIRLKTDRDAVGVTASFHYGISAGAEDADAASFASLADADSDGAYCAGIIRAREGGPGMLHFSSRSIDASGRVIGTSYYEIGPEMKLIPRPDDVQGRRYLETNGAVEGLDFEIDDASVVVVEGTRRFRLPKGSPAYDTRRPGGWPRGVREVVTERSLFNAHGTFYMLPRGNSGGVAGIKPICTHGKWISDFCSWRGMLVLAGTKSGAKPDGHYVAAADGKAGLWFGDIDDLWRLGKPRGIGGPWRSTAVEANVPSDPYLMTGYDKKTMLLSHDSTSDVVFSVEVDFVRDGTWKEYGRFTVKPGEVLTHEFPAGYSAHWVRLRVDTPCIATAQFRYE